MRFTMSSSLIKPKINRADARNAVFLCQIHCPLSNNIPDWLKLTAEGRLKEAYELSQSTNNMPEVLEEFVLRIGFAKVTA